MTKKPRVLDRDALTFTPFIEELAFWYRGGDLCPADKWPSGISVALVFGKVCRFWQLKRESCRVAVQRLADELGLSRDTAERCLKVLERDRLIVDLTPDRTNRPHEYVVTTEAAKVVRGVRAMHNEAGLAYVGAPPLPHRAVVASAWGGSDYRTVLDLLTHGA